MNVESLCIQYSVKTNTSAWYLCPNLATETERDCSAIPNYLHGHVLSPSTMHSLFCSHTIEVKFNDLIFERLKL